MFKNKKDIFYHVSKSSTPVLKEYLQNCDDINAVNKYQKTAINFYLNECWKTMVELCYDGEVSSFDDWDLDITWDGSVIRYTCPESELSSLEALIDAGADIDAIDRTQKTALIHAVNFGDITAARLLINAGANIFIKDCNDKSALDYARMHKHETLVSLLETQEKAFLNAQDMTMSNFVMMVKRDLPRLKR